MPHRNASPVPHLEPVAAYDRLAPVFAAASNRRHAYLDTIDRLVMAEIPSGAGSLLDIGAGDGTRALRIVAAKSISNTILLEPSAAMRARWPVTVGWWPIRAEELHTKAGQFEVITCLWNVLGHILPAESRIAVLRECARLLSPDGLLLVDVNHRYNAQEYGIVPTAVRMLWDRVHPDVRNGDVTVRWQVDRDVYATKGHVFTHREFCRLARAAGFIIQKRMIVDYETGHVRRFSFAGNLLYVLRRAIEPV